MIILSIFESLRLNTKKNLFKEMLLMNNSDERILLLVTSLSQSDYTKQGEAESVYCSFENSLRPLQTLLTAKGICSYCRENRKELENIVKDVYDGITNESKLYNTHKQTANSILNEIEKTKLRIILYPGERSDIAELNVHEATHNMIIQFDNTIEEFKATEPHKYSPPSFYQVCKSVEIAIRHIEALLIDAGMCHYTGVSDAAMHHDDKQGISKDKVDFLKQICKNKTNVPISAPAKKLVEYVCSKFDAQTPYISFLSIFTIAPNNNKSIEENINSFFPDYELLWQYFRLWYYKKKNLLFSENSTSEELVKKGFNRNVYQGQINFVDASDQILNEISVLKKAKEQNDEKEIHRYAFVILRNVPSGELFQICNSLFSGQIHQAKWRLIKWERLKDYEPINTYIEIVPILLEV